MRLSAITGLTGLILGSIFVGRTVLAYPVEIVLSCKGASASGDGIDVIIEKIEGGYQAKVSLVDKFKVQSPDTFLIDDPQTFRCGKVMYDASPRFKLVFAPPSATSHTRTGTANADYPKSAMKRFENLVCSF